MSALEDSFINLLATIFCWLLIGTVCMSPLIIVCSFVWSLLVKFRIIGWALGSNNNVGTVKTVRVRSPKTTVKPKAKPQKYSKAVVSDFSDEYKLPSLPFE